MSEGGKGELSDVGAELRWLFPPFSSQSSHTYISIPRANLEGCRTGKLGVPEPQRLVQEHAVKKEEARVSLMACVLSKVLAVTPSV